MPQFVIERDIPGLSKLSDSEFRALSQKSVAVLRGMGPEIQWLHSYVTGDKLYCDIAPDEMPFRSTRHAGYSSRIESPPCAVSSIRRPQNSPDNHAGTAAPGCPAERSSARSLRLAVSS